MSTTPQDPYGTGDEPDRSPESGPPSYGSTPPPPPGSAGSYGSTPPAYGSSSSGSIPSSYGSTPPAYGSSDPGSSGTPPAYSGGDYGQQSPYGYSFPKNSLGVWSLVLGLVGIFICGLFTGIPAIVVGHKARGAVAEGQANNPGLATAGIVLGWIATILSIIGIVVVVGLIATGAVTEFSTVDTSSF